MTLIAFVGFKGSGKNTAAQPLQASGFHALSFADAIKDALATIFRWDRAMLEGDTPESRAWREQVDAWWAERLGIPDFSPRRAMQLVGTEAMRDHFHPEVWVFSVERRISMLPPGSDVVLIDGRFPNELAMARRLGGIVARIRKGDDPEWFGIAARANAGDADALHAMKHHYRVHASEWAWVGSPIDLTFENDGTIEDLHAKVRSTFLTAGPILAGRPYANGRSDRHPAPWHHAVRQRCPASRP